MANNSQTMTDERRATARLVAHAIATGSSAITAEVDDRMKEGAPLIMAEWETPLSEVNERLQWHRQRGRQSAVVMLRRDHELQSLLSDFGDVQSPFKIRSDEIHGDSPVGMVWEALLMAVMSEQAVPKDMRTPSVKLGSFAMSMA